MTLQEFTARTGIYPDWALFETIEVHYKNFNGDKDAFCKAYKENASGLAEQIQRETDTVYIENLTRLTERLKKTLEALNRELEWQPASFGTGMYQDDYDDLAEDCTGIDGELKAMSEAEAKKLIAEEFGFSPDKVEIVETVHDYEVNMHGDLRKSAEYKRPPLYISSAQNYIRFDVRCAAVVWHYEMIGWRVKINELGVEI